MKSYLVLFYVVCICLGCRPSKTYYEIEGERVRNCREKWSYDSLQTKTEIKLLLFDKKGHFDLTTWPNFFIGVTNTNDTIGIISFETYNNIQIGKVYTFFPAKVPDTPKKATYLNNVIPIFTVHKHKNKNNYYCAIDTLYFGELELQNSN